MYLIKTECVLLIFSQQEVTPLEQALHPRWSCACCTLHTSNPALYG